MIDARPLQSLIATTQAGSIRGAASALRVAPSAISRHIAELERSLGVPLFKRTGRGVVLTSAGQLVFDHAMRVSDDSQLLIEQIDEHRSGRRGLVRIWCGEGFAADLIDNGIRSAAAELPDLRYMVELAGTDSVMAALADGRGDIGIAYNPVLSTRIRSLASARKPLLAVVPPEHPLADRASVSLAELANCKLALLGESHGVRQLIGRAAADHDKALSPILETASIDVLRRFVTSSLGVTVLPEFAVTAEATAGRVRLLPIEDTSLANATAHLLVRSSGRRPAIVEVMADHLAKTLFAFRP